MVDVTEQVGLEVKHIQCVPNTRKLRNAAGWISSCSALSLVAPASCSQSVTEEIKVDVGVTFLRSQFSSISFSLWNVTVWFCMFGSLILWFNIANTGTYHWKGSWARCKFWKLPNSFFTSRWNDVFVFNFVWLCAKISVKNFLTLWQMSQTFTLCLVLEQASLYLCFLPIVYIISIDQ
jgi:hypothetical protein